MSQIPFFARCAVCVAFALFVLLLLGVPLLESSFAAPGLLGLSWGQVLLLAIHFVPVIFAWIYVWQRKDES